MSDAATSGILGVMATLAGVAIAGIFDLLKRREENKRWYAEFFLTRKLDTLHNLYAHIVEAYQTLIRYGNQPTAIATFAEFRETIAPIETKYLHLMGLADLYLAKNEREAMREWLGALRQASMAILCHLPTEEVQVNVTYRNMPDVYNVDFEGLTKGRDTATQCLEKLLNPKVLTELSGTPRR